MKLLHHRENIMEVYIYILLVAFVYVQLEKWIFQIHMFSLKYITCVPP
jgi:hypothetical protein